MNDDFFLVSLVPESLKSSRILWSPFASLANIVLNLLRIKVSWNHFSF